MTTVASTSGTGLLKFESRAAMEARFDHLRGSANLTDTEKDELIALYRRLKQRRDKDVLALAIQQGGLDFNE